MEHIRLDTTHHTPQLMSANNIRNMNVTVENISSEKKGDSYLTHWKFNKKAPMQFTLVDPSSIKSLYGKKSSKQQSADNITQESQQQQIQFYAQQVPQQRPPVHSSRNPSGESHQEPYGNQLLSQRRFSAPVITFDDANRTTQFQPQEQNVHQSPSHFNQARLPQTPQFTQFTQYYAPQPIQQNNNIIRSPTLRKRSIHDMNEDSERAWSSLTNKKNKHFGAKWGEKNASTEEIAKDDSEVYGSDYISTLTPEQQAYIRGGRSRSVPAHVLSQQVQQLQPSPQYIASPTLTHHNSSPSTQPTKFFSPTNKMPPILPSISELQQQVENLQNNRRGSIDELSVNFSTRATMGDQSIESFMRTEDMKTDVNNDMEEQIINDEMRRIRRRVSYTEEMNSLELMKDRRGSQPNPLDIAKQQYYNQMNRPLLHNASQLTNSSPTVIMGYTFPLKRTEESTPNSRRRSSIIGDEDIEGFNSNGGDTEEHKSSNTPLNANELVLPPILGSYESTNNNLIPPVLPSVTRRLSISNTKDDKQSNQMM